MRHSTDGLVDDVLRQQRAIGGRTPVYGRLLGVLAGLFDDIEERLAVAWADRSFNAYYDRPLLLLAALRADALRTGPSHPLWAAIAADEPDLDAATPGAVADSLSDDRTRVWSDLRRRFIQTNDTSRAVVWRWPLSLIGHGRPVVLVDLGASAGLNLVADRLPGPWRLPGGRRLLAAGEDLTARLRLGLDVRPLDAGYGEDALWLQACVWPGETDRIHRLRSALEAFGCFEGPDRPVLETCDVAAWPERLTQVSADHPEALILAYQTIVRDYLSPPQRHAWEHEATEWLAAQAARTALWIQLEMIDPIRNLECTIRAGVAAGGSVESFELARTGFHPSQVRPDARAVAEFRSRFPA